MLWLVVLLGDRQTLDSGTQEVLIKTQPPGESYGPALMLGSLSLSTF